MEVRPDMEYLERAKRKAFKAVAQCRGKDQFDAATIAISADYTCLTWVSGKGCLGLRDGVTREHLSHPAQGWCGNFPLLKTSRLCSLDLPRYFYLDNGRALERCGIYLYWLLSQYWLCGVRTELCSGMLDAVTHVLQ